MSSIEGIIHEELVQGFLDRVSALLRANPELERRLFETEKSAYALGERAAEYVVAPVVWREAVGEVIDTAELCRILGVTRQAVGQRVVHRTLLALPGRTTRYYPLWQVDWSTSTIREAAGELLHAWHEIEPEVEPLTIATWAMTPQDYLGGRVPAETIGDDPRVVVEAARVTAGIRAR